MQQCFVVPWMNPADINRTPDWVNDTVWYQIFPDRFCNGTPGKMQGSSVPGETVLLPMKNASAAIWRGSVRSFPI